MELSEILADILFLFRASPVSDYRRSLHREGDYFFGFGSIVRLFMLL